MTDYLRALDTEAALGRARTERDAVVGLYRETLEKYAKLLGVDMTNPHSDDPDEPIRNYLLDERIEAAIRQLRSEERPAS